MLASVGNSASVPDARGAEVGTAVRRDHAIAGRVLWVTDEVPDRRLGGGSIRQARLFRWLASAFPVDLLLAGSLTDEAVRAAAASVIELPKKAAPWSNQPLARRALELAVTLGSRYPMAVYPAAPARRDLSSAIHRAAHRYRVICVEHEALAPVAQVIPDTPKVITFHHLISEMITQELTTTEGARQRWFLNRELKKAHALERVALQRYDRVVVCSETDAVRLHALAEGGNGSKLRLVPNGVDLTDLPPTLVPSEPRVLFPGSLNYAPNVHGALWFCREVWPRIRSEVPDATLVLAGRAPIAEILELEHLPGVEVRGDVPSMVTWFQWARVVVVPLLVGTGTRLKALEAMAASRPVVGTAIGLEGLGIVESVHARMADTPEAFSGAVIEALRKDSVAQRLGAAGRRHVEQRFGWDQLGPRLVEVVSELLGERN